MSDYELVVVGGGSGGLGAAISASRLGVKTLLVDEGQMLGGTSTCGGVNCWEMGVGGTGIPFELYQRLTRIPGAVGINSMGRHFSYQEEWYWPHEMAKVCFPGGESVIDADRRYADTLRRHPGPDDTLDEAFRRRTWHGVMFEPEVLSSVARAWLDDTGCCEVRLGTRFVSAAVGDGRVLHAELGDGSRVTADAWVDATGDAVLCASCRCDLLSGIDPESRFHEPGAPVEGSDGVNGVTLVYRVNRAEGTGVESLPQDIPADCWWAPNFPPMCCNHYPSGDRNCNMLPTMEGREAMQLGREAAYAECERRVRAHWHFVQKQFAEFRNFTLSWVAPLLGVRESNRVVCEHMLNENDILAGLASQRDTDLVAIADHALDRHGEGGSCPEVAGPYGVPYRSMVPVGFRNLLVACRGAGFSSIAATSCRLSRTLMQLGQAAGNGVAISRERGCDPSEVPASMLRERLQEQHCQLEWPIDAEILRYIDGPASVGSEG